MKDLTHVCTACPEYPRCNFNRERVYYLLFTSMTSQNASKILDPQMFADDTNLILHSFKHKNI